MESGFIIGRINWSGLEFACLSLSESHGLVELIIQWSIWIMDDAAGAAFCFMHSIHSEKYGPSSRLQISWGADIPFVLFQAVNTFVFRLYARISHGASKRFRLTQSQQSTKSYTQS